VPITSGITLRAATIDDVPLILRCIRGLGIGKALLTRLAAIAVERDYGRFEWSVLDWNEDAIRFYKGMGADVMPEWRICRVTGDALQALGAPP
jgi:ribosomal protein S18 acetylase RimI-like enzyme